MAKLKLTLQGRPLWLLFVVAAAALVAGLLIPTTPGFRGPLFTIENDLLGAVILALGGFIANLYADRGQLYSRLGKLETDLEKLRERNEAQRGDLAAATTFINRVGLWLAGGMKGPLPQPPEQLLKHGVDDELWDDPALGGTD